jgi:ATP-dependent protease ClpP protease subunit
MRQAKSTIIFEGEMEYDEVKSLIQDLESCEQGEIDLYFSSNGGFLNIADILIEYINRSDKKINLIANGLIQSCAFYVLAFTKCNKIITDSVIGMIHKHKTFRPTIFGRPKEMKKTIFTKEDDAKIIEYNDKIMKYSIEKLRKAGVHEDYIKSLLKGKDTYIDNQTMKQLFSGDKFVDKNKRSR